MFLIPPFSTMQVRFLPMEETFPDRHPALICGIVNTTALDAQAEFYSCSRLEKSNIAVKCCAAQV